MRVNVQPMGYQTVGRGGQEFGLNAMTPWQPGETETVFIRFRNVNPTRLDAVGSVSLVLNGHIADPNVQWGSGRLDTQGRITGPTQMEASPVTLIPGGVGNLVVNVRIPYGTYLEIQVEVEWGNVDAPPVAVFGGEDATAGVPVMVVRGVIATGFPPVGAVPPVAVI